MTFGTALVAIGTYVFKFPNNFSTGGVTGMAVILSSVFPAISSSTYAGSHQPAVFGAGLCCAQPGLWTAHGVLLSAVLRGCCP